MNRVKIKICGIQTIENALNAIDAGADFLGFNFVPTSKRYIKPDDAQMIIKIIKGKIKIVGVFQNENIKKVKKILKKVDIDYLQLHGQEDQKYIKQLNFPVIKTIYSLTDTQNLVVDYFLLDRIQQGKGKMVKSGIANEIVNKFPTFLAGGLTPENVANKVRQVKPFAIDVSSGVETNGVKDPEKVRKFIQNTKGVAL